MKFDLLSRTSCVGRMLFLFVLLLSKPAHAVDAVHTGLFSNLAVSGYDVVAYFTEAKPVKGNDDFSTEYKNAEWHCHLDCFQGTV